MREKGDIISFIRNQDFVMVNPNLGSGSFGKTVVLQDPAIDELFVAKKYDPTGMDEEEKNEFYKSFLREIKIMYKLNHRNIVRVFNYYLYPSVSTGVIIMEYIDGKNIADHISAGIVPWAYREEVDGIFTQLIDAFAYMEEHGIVHRDIREGNILVDKSGCVKVIDFGLGKIFHKVENESTDSLVGEINRLGLDLLPEEYFSGKYDSLTDMFYLAELFRRLLRQNSLYEDFSYKPLLEKMVKEKRIARYKSFTDIKRAISNRRFESLDISEKDRDIYQKFSSSLYSVVSAYSERPDFCSDPSEFLKSLDGVLENNLLEDYVQSVIDLIRCVISTPLKYRPNINVEVACVRNFRDWFCMLGADTQRRVLANIIHKLLQIRVEQNPLDDIPF